MRRIVWLLAVMGLASIPIGAALAGPYTTTGVERVSGTSPLASPP